MGDDWNGIGGGNTDLGDTVYAIGNGIVSYARDHGPGWGNVVRVLHKVVDQDTMMYESLYAHLDTILVEKGELLVRGQPLGTIGNADGAYWAHLHLEVRDKLHLPVGGGYSTETAGYLDPTQFIEENRPE